MSGSVEKGQLRGVAMIDAKNIIHESFHEEEPVSRGLVFGVHAGWDGGGRWGPAGGEEEGFGLGQEKFRRCVGEPDFHASDLSGIGLNGGLGKGGVAEGEGEVGGEASRLRGNGVGRKRKRKSERRVVAWGIDQLYGVESPRLHATAEELKDGVEGLLELGRGGEGLKALEGGDGVLG